MAYETEDQELKRVVEDNKRFEANRKKREAQKAADKATKYSLEEIKAAVESAYCSARDRSASPIEIIADAQAAQAMIAYNEMIERRWENA